ncbi:MAG: O-antigen ligase family protein [Candidatus Bipolaricaulia bacterium]
MTRSTGSERLLHFLLLGFCFVLPLVFSPLGYQYTRIVFILLAIPPLLLVFAFALLRKEPASSGLTLPLPFLLGLALLAVAALSLIGSTNLQIGLESLGLLIWAVLFYLLLANIIATERQFRQLLTALFLAGSLAALYGLVQYYGYTLFPRPQRLPTAGPGNMIATFGNKNYLASFLGPLVPVGFLLLFGAARRWQRWVIFLGLVLIWAAVIASGTRSVWLGLALGLAYLAVAGLVMRGPRALLRRNGGWLAGLAGVMALIIVLFALPTPINRTDIAGRVTSGVEALSNPYVRYYDWWIAWEMGRARPLIGAGLGDFKIDYSDSKARFLETERGSPYRGVAIPQAMQAHNEYLQAWAELGSLGLLLILALIGAIFYSSWRSLGVLRAGRAKEEGPRPLATLALQAGLIVLLADAFFNFPFHLPASAILAVACAALLESRHLAARPGPSLKLGRRGVIALSILTLLLAGTTWTFTVRDLAAEIYFQRGERLLAAGSTAEATAALEKSLRLDFAPKKVLFDLGLIYMDSDLTKAEAFFLRALRTSAADPAAYLNLTEICRARGEYERALAYARRGGELEPTELEFLYLQMWLLAETGKIPEALRLSRQLTASQDGLYRAKAYALVGDIYFLQEHRDEAVLNYQLALAEVQQEAERLKAWEGKSVTPQQYRWVMERYEELKTLAEKLQEALKKLEL